MLGIKFCKGEIIRTILINFHCHLTLLISLIDSQLICLITLNYSCSFLNCC